MGSIRARADNGSLFFDFRYKGLRCREQTVLEDNPSNRKRMEKALAVIEAQIADGTFNYQDRFPNSKNLKRILEVPGSAQVLSKGAEGAHAIAPTSVQPGQPLAQASTPTFTTYTCQWLSEHQVEWRRSHIKVLLSTLEGHLLPHFGAMEVGRIGRADVLAFRAKLAALPGRSQRVLSPKRINGILAPLRQILNEAAERHGFVSPTVTLKPLKNKKSDVEPFTLDQVQQILATVRADYRCYFTVRFFTGMRTGEAHGLKWKWVDFERRLILVRETFVLGEDEYTKTDSSQRDIQMTQVVFEAFQRQWAATGHLSEYVFCNREGLPLDNTNFNDRVWKPLLAHLGLAQRRPYQMRHTAATLWLASGESPEWIARQLGHASTQMLFHPCWAGP